MDQDIVSAVFEYCYSVVILFLVYYFLRRSLFAPHSRKDAVKRWVMFGFVVNFYGLSWLYSVYPLPWLQEGALQLVGIALLHLILSVATAIPYSLIALHRHTRIAHRFHPTVFASLLTLAEVGRAIIISLLYLGKDTTVGLHFTAGTIGNALSTTPLIELAYFGGTFALTFVLGYLVYITVSKKHAEEYWKHGMGIIFLLLCLHYFVPITTLAPGNTVGIVTTNFSLPSRVEDYESAFKEQAGRIHQATLSLASSSPTFIVYPEDSRYISHLSDGQKKELLRYFPETLFIDGGTIRNSKGLSNISLFYLPETQKKVGRGKEFLLPFNEYIPFVFSKIFLLFIDRATIDTYTREHSYTPIYSDKTILFDKTRIGTLLCSEILSYQTIEELKDEHPSIVFFQSRLDVFHNNMWFIMHLRSFTKVAAAQLRVPLISSVSGAPSLIISPQGRVEQFIPAGFSTSTYTFR